MSNAAGSGGAAVGRSYAYTYDDARRLTGITSASGEQVLFELDGLGNVKREELRNTAPPWAAVTRPLQPYQR